MAVIDIKALKWQPEQVWPVEFMNILESRARARGLR